MLQIGSVVDGKYKILNKIGQGGMSIVYLAMNERANKQWAIKEVRKDGVQNFEVVKQGLIVETDLLKKLNHSNLPSIIDVIDGDGTFLIVMDYIEGRTLSSILKEYGAQAQEDVIEWAKQLCDVLGYLHSRKPAIIYRDMKPSNVMLRPDGKVMLIDFGTAREFKESSVADTTCLGTQGYAAPEQYGGHGQTDARTDIYCLGATLYHLLTGHNPSEPPYEMYPIRTWNPALSSGLEKVILKCTQKNPEDRYQSCAELMYALEHYDELDIEFQKKQNKKWMSFLVTASLAVLTGIGAVGFKTAETKVTASTYDSYIREAEALETTDAEQCMEYYENAIRLNPSKGDAYEKLLEFFLWKHNDTKDTEQEQGTTCEFTEDEEQEIRKMLGITGDTNRSNEEYLENDTDAYNKFAYELGKAYYYSYNGEGNKAASRKWLGIAAESEPTEELNERNISRAKNLYKIASYYDSLRVRNQAGDSMVSFSDYWLDLTKMAEEETGNSDNVLNTLQFFKEMSSQIFTNANNFKEAGITKEQMVTQLENIEEHTKKLQINKGDANASFAEELKEDIVKNLELAFDNVNAAFNMGNIGLKEEGGTPDAADTAADTTVS